MPGIVAMLGVWLLVRRVFMRAAAGAVVLASGARPPDPTRPTSAKRRLTDIVALLLACALALLVRLGMLLIYLALALQPLLVTPQVNLGVR